MLPRTMKARREALQKAFGFFQSYTNARYRLFEAKETDHAGLKLQWMKPKYHDLIGPKDQFQVVVAKIEAHTESRPHYHEIGASSFLVLGPAEHYVRPKDLIFRSGFPAIEHLHQNRSLIHYDDSAFYQHKRKVNYQDTGEILAGQVHHFENRHNKPAYILIVTHPIISIETGNEDTYFVPMI